MLWHRWGPDGGLLEAIGQPWRMTVFDGFGGTTFRRRYQVGLPSLPAGEGFVVVRASGLAGGTCKKPGLAGRGDEGNPTRLSEDERR